MTVESNSKVALITGATGQDGAYLPEPLLPSGYTVHGVKRQSSPPPFADPVKVGQMRATGALLQPSLLCLPSQNLIRLTGKIAAQVVRRLGSGRSPSLSRTILGYRSDRQ